MKEGRIACDGLRYWQRQLRCYGHVTFCSRSVAELSVGVPSPAEELTASTDSALMIAVAGG
jgi:hypothetical protein